MYGSDESRKPMGPGGSRMKGAIEGTNGTTGCRGNGGESGTVE